VSNPRQSQKKTTKKATRQPARSAERVRATQRRVSRAFDKVIVAIEKHGDRLRRIPGVLSVRPGYRFSRGRLSAIPAIVVTVVRKRSPGDVREEDRIPRTLDGVPVDVAPATPAEQLGAMQDADAAGRRQPRPPADEIALPGWDRMEQADEATGVAADSDRLPYQPPPNARLDEVKAAMRVTCHVSPDAGWKTLSEFLARVRRNLTVGMYDFTAPHVLGGLRSAMSQADGQLSVILDPGQSLGGDTKANDLPEDEVKDGLDDALSDRFDFVWAPVGRKKVTQPIFPTAYHVKVAVDGRRAFWLSSGNWQSSNQPNLAELDLSIAAILRRYNREWHVVVGNGKLARTYGKFLAWDIEQARPLQAAEAAPEADVSALPAFELLVPAAVLDELEADVSEPRFFEPATFTFTADSPLRVQPLLTPDNFVDHILPLVQSARRSLFLQNQYIKIGKTPDARFTALVDALFEKVNEGLDVRVILRDLPDTRQMLEGLQFYAASRHGIADISRFTKVQPGSHTKGIVVDSKTVAVGSHNWSMQGVLQNRDATLIFFNAKIARYYEAVFLYDWDNLARRKVVAEEAMPIVARAGGATPAEADAAKGMLRVPWDFDED
jgi:hypothetical protein